MTKDYRSGLFWLLEKNFSYFLPIRFLVDHLITLVLNTRRYISITTRTSFEQWAITSTAAAEANPAVMETKDQVHLWLYGHFLSYLSTALNYIVSVFPVREIAFTEAPILAQYEISFMSVDDAFWMLLFQLVLFAPIQGLAQVQFALSWWAYGLLWFAREYAHFVFNLNVG